MNGRALRSGVPACAMMLALMSAAACRTSDVYVGHVDRPTHEIDPPAACDSVWADPEAVDLVEGLTAATAPGPPVWGQYGLEDATYVIYAGESAEGGSCLGVWQAGEVKDYRIVATRPRLLTPLFGYFFPWEGNGGPFDGLVGAAAQPPEIRAWLGESGANGAVIVPVRVEGLPFELTTLHKVQVALHEAFHVTVQAPRWLGPGGDWPVWDLQPEREALESCYSGDPSVESALSAERKALKDLVIALLDDDKPGACRAGEEFLDRRETRYDLLEDVHVPDFDGVAGSCREAEAIMELEEGTADFASWTRLFNMGQASREDLMRQYGAEQKDVFYRTGAMQLHAVSLMDPDGFLQTTAEIVASKTLAEGSLAGVLSREIVSYCR